MGAGSIPLGDDPAIGLAPHLGTFHSLSACYPPHPLPKDGQFVLREDRIFSSKELPNLEASDFFSKVSPKNEPFGCSSKGSNKNLRVRIPAILAGGGGGGRLKKDVLGGERGGSNGPSCFML